jgi:hypothetical protein
VDEQCPYCGETQRALKNHVRLTDGKGHGRTGTYPSTFDGDRSVSHRESGPESISVEASELDAGQEFSNATIDGGEPERNVIPVKAGSADGENHKGESSEEINRSEGRDGGDWLWIVGGLGVAAAASRYSQSRNRRRRM